MERIILTEETVKAATTYAPLSAKEQFVEHCTMKCLQRVQVNMDDGSGGAMPNMYMEDTSVKARYLMSALAVLYIGTPIKELPSEDGDIWLMTAEEFDRWGASHVLNQLDRMKGNAELRDRIFDLLRDYRDLERRLSTSVYNTIRIMNDPANRIFQKLQMDTSNEALEAQKKNLEELMAEFEKMKSEKENPATDTENKE